MTQSLKIAIAQLNRTVGTNNKTLTALRIPPKPVIASASEATQTLTPRRRHQFDV